MPRDRPKVYDENQKRAEALLAEAEKKYDKNDVALIEPLIDVYMYSEQGSSSETLLNRAIAIAEDAYQKGLVGQTMLQAGYEFSIAGTRRFPEANWKLKERLLRLAYKMELGSGANPYNSETFGKLCECLHQDGQTAEAIALYKSTLDFLSKSKSPSRESMMRDFRQRYMYFLQQAGQQTEAAEVKKQVDQETLLLNKHAQEDADTKLQNARAKAEVDPVGLMQALFTAASTHLKLNDRKTAQRLVTEAVAIYDKIPAGDKDSEVTILFWQYVVQQLEQAQTKADENIAAIFLHATEHTRDCNAHIDDLVRHFIRLHRKSDAITFLESVMKDRTSHHDVFDDVYPIACQLLSLYDPNVDSPKSNAVLRQLNSLARAESANTTQQVTRMLELAKLCIKAHDFTQAQELVNTATAITTELDPALTSTDLSSLSTFTREFLAHNQLPEAANLVKVAYKNVATRPANNTLQTWLTTPIRQVCSAYEQRQDYQSEEAFLNYLVEQNMHEGTELPVESLLIDAYLQHAAQLKARKKSAESEILVNKSAQLFEKLKGDSSISPTTLEQIEVRRNRRMIQLGLIQPPKIPNSKPEDKLP